MRLDRLLAITVMLINRKRMTAKELADHFEVSVRTIHRDIEAINLSGIPIASFQGTNGGFAIMENYKLDRQLLGTDDVLSIITALKGISTTMDDIKIQKTMEKIKGLIPQSEAGKLNGRNDQVIIDFSPWGSSARQKQKINIIRDAIEETRLISFAYTNARGENTRRCIEPMWIAFKGFAWYVYGYCRAKGDFRVFKLTRIKDLCMENERYTKKEIFFEEYYSGKNWGAGSPAANLLLRFKPAARSRVEDFYEEESIQVQEDGYLLVRVNYPEDEWVYGHILSFGDDVEVLEPAHIRVIIRERAGRICEMYGTSETYM
jgi:predicted DNA-binding transcriptional regulator YafY